MMDMKLNNMCKKQMHGTGLWYCELDTYLCSFWGKWKLSSQTFWHQIQSVLLPITLSKFLKVKFLSRDFHCIKQKWFLEVVLFDLWYLQESLKYLEVRQETAYNIKTLQLSVQ